MMDYQGKKVRVFGLGESGLAMALWLARCGADVSVADTRAQPPRLEALRAAAPQVAFCAGPFESHLVEGMDALAVSPGLAPGGELAPVCAAAEQCGIPIWSEIELFAQALAGLRAQRDYTPRVLAVTGTNGKTTVTSLTGLLCERAGLTVRVAGNISPAALDVLRQALDAGDLPQVWVLELSSFQLHFTHSLRADAAVVLNLSQDHLDWHGDMAAYAAAKARIFGPDTIRIGNRDDRQTMKMLEGGSAALSFGTDAPDAAPGFGLVTEHGMTWLVQAQARDGGAEGATEGGRRRRRQPALELEAPLIQRLMPADALQIRGRHNAANALAALALCSAIGLPLAALLHALREYRGEPHRVELIATIVGVEYYDDSKGTNVGATVAALNGLGVDGGRARLHLIAGGDGKGQDFAPLAQPVARHAHGVYLIGRDAPALRAALAQTEVPLIDCASLEQAVQQAAAQAQPGDAVLLSPACASFDMFRDYAHRAQVFVDAVRALALEQGEVMP